MLDVKQDITFPLECRLTEICVLSQFILAFFIHTPYILAKEWRMLLHWQVLLLGKPTASQYGLQLFVSLTSLRHPTLNMLGQSKVFCQYFVRCCSILGMGALCWHVKWCVIYKFAFVPLIKIILRQCDRGLYYLRTWLKLEVSTGEN